MDLTPFKECRAHKQWLFVSNEQKHYRPCCWFRTDLSADTIAEYQEKLSQCDIEENCNYCIQMEEHGDWSPRTSFESYTGAKKFVITASFDNICNLKCVTCSPMSSSQLVNELPKDFENQGITKKHYMNVLKQAPAKIEFMKDTLRTVMGSQFEELRFEILGGEPLVNPMIFEFIDWLAEQPYASKTNINITTNGTTHTRKLVEYRSKFGYIGVQFSIDGIGDMFEYLRTNAEYEVMSDIVKDYYTIATTRDGFGVGTNYTLSWMNCLHFSEWYNWVSTNFPEMGDILVTKLESPSEYSVDVLPLALRKQILEEVLSKVVTNDNPAFKKALDIYIQHMSSPNDVPNLREYYKGIVSLTTLDRKRNLDHTVVCKDILEKVNTH